MARSNYILLESPVRSADMGSTPSPRTQSLGTAAMIASIRAKSLDLGKRAREFGSTGCILFASGFFILFGETASADFKAGLDAYTQNRYEIAFREWLPLAEQGDGLAQLYVARMYEEGKVVRRSFSEARRWYDLAAATLPPGEERERAIRERIAWLLN